MPISLEEVNVNINRIENYVRCVQSDMDLSKSQASYKIKRHYEDLAKLRTKLDRLERRYYGGEELVHELKQKATDLRAELEQMKRIRQRVLQLRQIYNQVNRMTKREKLSIFNRLGISEHQISKGYIRDLQMLAHAYDLEAFNIRDLMRNGSKKFLDRQMQLITAISKQQRYFEEYLLNATCGYDRLAVAYDELEKLQFTKQNAKPLRRLEEIQAQIAELEGEIALERAVLDPDASSPNSHTPAELSEIGAEHREVPHAAAR